MVTHLAYNGHQHFTHFPHDVYTPLLGWLPTLPRVVTKLDVTYLLTDHPQNINPRSLGWSPANLMMVTNLSYDSPPASHDVYTPLLECYPPSQGCSPTFPRMVTFPFQSDHPPLPQCSPILHRMVTPMMVR